MVLKRFLNGHEVTEGESQEMEEELANFAKKTYYENSPADELQFAY